MAGTLENPQTDTTPELGAAPPPAPREETPAAPDDASRLCASCAALLDEGQDWCLECGTAQPGRLGGRQGWRAALTVVALTAILAVGAVAAAYAALSSDAERVASAPAPPSAQPVVEPPPPPPPAPVEEAPPAPVPTDDPIPAPSPGGDDFGGGGGGGGAAADEDFGDDFGGGGGTGGAPGGGSGGSGSAIDGDGGGTQGTPSSKPFIALSAGAASTFDPQGRGGGLTGDPAEAIDGRPKTAWEAPVGSDGRVGIGLMVSLDEAKAIGRIRVRAGTPGFTVEVHGSKLGTAPGAAPGSTRYWTKLDTTRDFGTTETLRVGGTYRHVLLWFTDHPADTKVMIPEVELLK